jgi:S-adenosylmethionine:tRNA ribosyltransferase-isomerase
VDPLPEADDLGAVLAFAFHGIRGIGILPQADGAGNPFRRPSSIRPYNPQVLVSDFNYVLPPELIAQHALPERDASRLLHLERASGKWQDRSFRELPDLVRPDDLLVLNNTRVFPARLFGHRSGSRAQPVSPRNPAAKEFLKGQVEVLLTRQTSEREWQALVRPGRKIGVGERLHFGEQGQLEAEVIARGDFGERTLRFAPVADFFAAFERLGHVPLPPYIARPDAPADRERYQTVYASQRGSVAAPTAGLHFTPGTLDRLRARGIETAEVTLHVGLGTFQPVHAKRVEDHKMQGEPYSISGQAAEQLNRARAAGRRVVAVGTTTVRALEHAALENPDGRIEPGSRETDLFIYRGSDFRVVGALLTNFHLPQSTLLMLVAAFAGRERLLAAYRHAVEERYRFYSYGDCMLIE